MTLHLPQSHKMETEKTTTFVSLYEITSQHLLIGHFRISSTDSKVQTTLKTVKQKRNAQ